MRIIAVVVHRGVVVVWRLRLVGRSGTRLQRGKVIRKRSLRGRSHEPCRWRQRWRRWWQPEHGRGLWAVDRGTDDVGAWRVIGCGVARMPLRSVWRMVRDWGTVRVVACRDGRDLVAQRCSGPDELVVRSPPWVDDGGDAGGGGGPRGGVEGVLGVIADGICGRAVGSSMVPDGSEGGRLGSGGGRVWCRERGLLLMAVVMALALLRNRDTGEQRRGGYWRRRCEDGHVTHACFVPT